MKISHVLNHLAAPTEFTCGKCNCIAVKQEKRGLVSSSNRFLARESTFTKPEKFSGCGDFPADLLIGIILRDVNSRQNFGPISDIVLIQEHNQNVTRIYPECNQRIFCDNKARVFKPRTQF